MRVGFKHTGAWVSKSSGFGLKILCLFVFVNWVQQWVQTWIQNWVQKLGSKIGFKNWVQKLGSELGSDF